MATRYVNASSSGGDGTTNGESGASAAYATLATADLGLRVQNWTGQDLDLEVWAGSANAAITTFAYLANINWPNPPTNFRIIFKGATTHTWEANIGRVEYAGSSPILRIDINCNVEIIAPRLRSTISAGSADGIYLGPPNAANTYIVRQAINRGPNAASGTGRSVFWATTAGKQVEVNNLTYNWRQGHIHASGSASTARLCANNTVVNAAGGAAFSMGNAGANQKLYNNIAQGGSTQYANLTSLTSGGNISGDTSSPQTGLRSLTIAFTNSAGDDYSTSDSQADVGTDLSADSTYAFNTDIVGTTRSAWFAGMFEPAAGGYTLTADGGSFSLTGQDVGLLAARVLAADNGSYSLGGQSVGLIASRVLGVAHGSFVLSGQDVALNYSPAGSYTLTADVGAFTLSGQSVGLLSSRVISVSAGYFALSGQDVGISYGAPSVVVIPSARGVSVNISYGRRTNLSTGRRA